ncbi:25163_t:CDS:2, partial [Racocetra persica]
KTTLAPKRSEKIDKKENAWLNLASTGTLVFAEKYEGEAIQYNVNSMYIYEILKKETSWPIATDRPMTETEIEEAVKDVLIDE